MKTFDSLLEVKRLGLGINQALALSFIVETGTIRVCEVQRAIESNAVIASQLITRLIAMGMVRAVRSRRLVKYKATLKGIETTKQFTNPTDEKTNAE